MISAMADAMKSVGDCPQTLDCQRSTIQAAMYEVNIDVKPDELLDWDWQNRLMKQRISGSALEKTDWYRNGSNPSSKLLR
jgi:hypothetical protein